MAETTNPNNKWYRPWQNRPNYGGAAPVLDTNNPVATSYAGGAGSIFDNPLNPSQPSNASPDVRYTSKPQPLSRFIDVLPKQQSANPWVYVEAEKNRNQRYNKNMTREEKLARRYYSEGSALLNAYARLYPRTQQLQDQAAEDYGNREYNYFARNAPRYVEAITTADPMQAELRRNLNSAANYDLMGELSPSVRREIQQGSRAAWASRGLAQSPSSAVEELFSLGDRGWQQHNQAMTNALNVGQFNKSVVGDPFLAVTGRASGNTPSYQPFTNPVARETVSDFDSFNLNNMLSKRNASVANRAASNQLIGSGLQAAGSLFGGIIGGAG